MKNPQLSNIYNWHLKLIKTFFTYFNHKIKPKPSPDETLSPNTIFFSEGLYCTVLLRLYSDSYCSDLHNNNSQKSNAPLKLNQINCDSLCDKLVGGHAKVKKNRKKKFPYSVEKTFSHFSLSSVSIARDCLFNLFATFGKFNGKFWEQC